MALRDLTRKLGRKAIGAARRLQVTWAHRRLSEQSVADSLEASYRTHDPWKMASDKEQFRFGETNRLLREQLLGPAGRVGSVLEIGCGEGHQSEHLAKLCDRLTGIDIVEVAIARARARRPDLEWIAGDLSAQPWADERARFDLVTGFEVVYYARDIPRLLRRMSRLGRACMVTYHRPAAPLMERPLGALPIAGRARFAFGDTEWRAAWWRNPVT